MTSQNGNPVCVDNGMRFKTHTPTRKQIGSVAKKKK
jgi:hypothetical protein